ncbi:MAG: hypothetical protein K9H26_03010 [Prolixibacteraceae bacterium]|nr:hypothetical protein [Prolixibacteraceae bacterium]
MKTITILKKNVLSVLLIGLIILTFNSCAKQSYFLNSSIVPAAEGKVKVIRDNKNQNYMISINVTDLANVERLQDNKNNYVVWMETDQGKIENLGQIDSSTGFLSNKLKASLKTSSSYKPVKIFITAEDNTDVQNPGEQIILSTDNF